MKRAGGRVGDVTKSAVVIDKITCSFVRFKTTSTISENLKKKLAKIGQTFSLGDESDYRLFPHPFSKTPHFKKLGNTQSHLTPKRTTQHKSNLALMQLNQPLNFFAKNFIIDITQEILDLSLFYNFVLIIIWWNKDLL